MNRQPIPVYLDPSPKTALRKRVKTRGTTLVEEARKTVDPWQGGVVNPLKC